MSLDYYLINIANNTILSLNLYSKTTQCPFTFFLLKKSQFTTVV